MTELRIRRVVKRVPTLEAVRWTMDSLAAVIQWAQTPKANRLRVQQFAYADGTVVMELILPDSGVGVPERGWVIKDPDGRLIGCSARAFRERFASITNSPQATKETA